jgi:hypothetical protein
MALTHMVKLAKNGPSLLQCPGMPLSENGIASQKSAIPVRSSAEKHSTDSANGIDEYSIATLDLMQSGLGDPDNIEDWIAGTLGGMVIDDVVESSSQNVFNEPIQLSVKASSATALLALYYLRD